MIKEIEIKNYKSINSARLELGRVNVFIGENGAGKSNILEVIALAGATAAEKLDNEFLVSRGIRVTRPEYMRPAFPDMNPLSAIEVSATDQRNQIISFVLNNDNAPYSKWQSAISSPSLAFDPEALKLSVDKYMEMAREKAKSPEDEHKELSILLNTLTKDIDRISAEITKLTTHSEKQLRKALPISIGGKNPKFSKILQRSTIQKSSAVRDLSSFVIFSPENSLLRTFEKEGQIQPLGINGEGLLKLLSFYSLEEDQITIGNVKESLQLLDWFDGFNTINVSSEAVLHVNDRFLSKTLTDFDHKSTNEGFFFLLFYFTLFNSKLTPPFFAIDNIDASLNPKLCEKLTSELVRLAKLNDKQTILTTHNPSVLDGLDLDDDEQRLFVISRSASGETKIKRILKPISPKGNGVPPRMSELFTRGMIGGLPKGF
jgi:AAA15 family ATPase/GTPase